MSVPQFDAVDTTDPVAAAAFLDLALSLPGVERWKRFSHDLLCSGDGDRVLDIGCGTGADAVALARRVCPSGRVVGVDLSRSLVTIATARAAVLGLPVTFQQADIHALPFADGSFDRTRIDRVLHFLPNPGPALREAVRVTAPGGRVVVTEPDWNRLAVSGGDPGLTAYLLEAGADRTQGAQIGSVLPRRLVEAGLQSIESHDSVLELSDYSTAAALFGLEGIAARAVQSGLVSPRDTVRWLRSLQYASADGRFRCSLGGVIATGTCQAIEANTAKNVA